MERICPACSCTSQHRTPPSQLVDTKRLETGLHTKEDIPSFPADGPMLWSFGEAAAFDGEVLDTLPEGEPNADIII
jgi:hypothetical protein